MSLITVCHECGQECEVDYMDKVSSCCSATYDILDIENIEEECSDYKYGLQLNKD